MLFRIVFYSIFHEPKHIKDFVAFFIPNELVIGLVNTKGCNLNRRHTKAICVGNERFIGCWYDGASTFAPRAWLTSRKWHYRRSIKSVIARLIGSARYCLNEFELHSIRFKIGRLCQLNFVLLRNFPLPHTIDLFNVWFYDLTDVF